jgi:hypothetical protein
MCGNVGAAGVLLMKQEKVVKELLIVDSLRGIDSTGVAVIARNYEVKVAKQVGNPYELMDSAKYNAAMSGANSCIIGHNRWGTQGKVNKANAHPFEFDTIVGAHNGTLTTKYKLHEHQYHDVDSAALYNHLDQKGLEDLMANLAGAWALVWWDKVLNTLNFLRNKERPLYLCWDKTGSCMFWASEYWMLSGVLSRNEIEFNKIELLPEDVHVSIEIGKDGKLEKPKLRNCASTHVFSNNTAYSYNHGHVQTTGDSSKNNQVVPSKASRKQLKLVNSKVSSKDAEAVFLEILKVVENDGCGGKYFDCYDWSRPEADVRWYFPRDINSLDMIGESITATYSGKYKLLGKEYWKVLSSSVKMDEETNTQVEELYRNNRGRMIDKNEWIKNHGTCDYCSESIVPTDAHAFTSGGQILCSSCMKDDSILQMVSTIYVTEKE